MTVIAGSWARIAHPSRSLVGVAEQVALRMGTARHTTGRSSNSFRDILRVLGALSVAVAQRLGCPMLTTNAVAPRRLHPQARYRSRLSPALPAAAVIR